MTEPSAPSSKRSFLSRRFSPLLTTWITAIVLAALIYWFEIEMPAFHDVVVPLYMIIGLLALAFTLRWVRTRGKNDRRKFGFDRRHTDRRSRSERQTPSM
jgi:hypothetical protein